nr:aldo/keto reductase [Saccharofermentans sp.]
IGFGTYRLGSNEKESELDTIRYGIDHYGMTLLDTAQMYGDGLSEKILGEAIRGYDRKKLFVVDKILPDNARKGLYLESCRKSLQLLGTDYIDLYLLHWRGGTDLQDMVDNMERLVSMGLIRHWGVSNFDTEDMEELLSCEKGENCFCDQILYNICCRGVEYDLVPWCKAHDVMVMAYSPLCNSREARHKVTGDELIRRISQDEQKSPESFILSFVVRNKDVATVFKTSSVPHLISNMKNVFVPIGDDDMNKLESNYKAPVKKCPLEKI